MTNDELAKIMAMDELRDESRKISLSNPDPVDIQNVKLILALANNVPDLVVALREERTKVEAARLLAERVLECSSEVPHSVKKLAFAFFGKPCGCQRCATGGS